MAYPIGGNGHPDGQVAPVFRHQQILGRRVHRPAWHHFSALVDGPQVARTGETLMPVRDHNALHLRIGRALVGTAIIVALLLPAIVSFGWGTRAGIYLALGYGVLIALSNGQLLALFSGSEINYDASSGYIFAAVATGVFAICAAAGGALGSAVQASQ
ncbi:MAG: hypothetical protein AB8B51_05660 [Sedimentitalea sp.]